MTTILSLYFLHLTGRQEPNPRITFEAPGLLMSVGLEQLSTASGVRLMASPQTKDQALIVYVKDVPLQDLMAKIADCAGAEWVKEEAGYRLVRTASLLRKQEEAHVRMETEKIAKAQAKLRDALARDGEFNDTLARSLAAQVQSIVDEARRSNGRLANWNHQQNVGHGLPAGRLARGLAIALDPIELQNLDRPGRMVFSSTPNRMQFPLPKSFSQLLAQYEAEHVRLDSQLPSGEPHEVGGLNAEIHNLLVRKKIVDRRPAKVLLEVRRNEFAGGLGLTLFVANRAGTVLERAYENLAMDPAMAGPPPAPPPALPGESPINLSLRSKAMAEALRSAIRSQGNEFPEIPEPARQVFLNPERHTLSELILAEMLIGAAKARGKNLVATPTELGGFFGTVILSTAPSFTPSQILAQLETFIMECQFKEAEAWFTLGISDPVLLRRSAFDRAALGRMIRAAVARQSVTVEEAAAFASTTPPEFERQFAMLYLMLCSPAAGRNFERMSWQALRFHGMLGPAQSQAFADGQAIPFSRLTPAQQALFHDLIFGNSDSMGEERRRQARNRPPEEADLFGYSESLRWQPTERYPNGLGPAAKVVRRETSGDAVLAKGTYDGHPTEREFDLNGLAYHLWSQSRNANAGPEPEFTEFRHMMQRTLTYSFDADEEFAKVGVLKERSQMSAPVNSIDQLPANFMARVKEQMAKIGSEPNFAIRPPN